MLAAPRDVTITEGRMALAIMEGFAGSFEPEPEPEPETPCEFLARRVISQLRQDHPAAAAAAAVELVNTIATTYKVNGCAYL